MTSTKTDISGTKKAPERVSPVESDFLESEISGVPHSENSDFAPYSGRKLGVFSIIFGFVGLFASWELATEYIKKLKNPGHTLNCDFSILVTCGPNMDSWQGSLFGFSNTIIGLAAFMAPIIVGVALLGGSRFSPVFWWLYQIGLTGGWAFVMWLSWQSVFALHTLCPWCMVVWTITIPLFWSTLAHAGRHGLFGAGIPGAPFQGLRNWLWIVILFNYLLIAAYAQVGVDWLHHLRRAFF
ncbi:MAG: vitamin K epoxide reductase family protein [Microbacteriaceae bacterium]|nr:vitamin K epoxide reductase family protein [Microbacteriaceae bacterium]